MDFLMRRFSILIFSAFLASCSKSGSSAQNLYRIPWPGDDGQYVMQNVPIETFDQPHLLQGRFVRVFVNPRVKDGELTADTPLGRFIRNKDGVSIPEDYASLQSAAIHAHFERLHAIDEAAGAKLSWPRKIGVQSNVVDPAGNSLQNNALFMGPLDALLIVPYSMQHLPIALNGGILAHEHFHMIFQAMVFSRLHEQGPPMQPAAAQNIDEWQDLSRRSANSPSTNKPTRCGPEPEERYKNQTSVQIYNSFYLRALNEGLADYWAWVYTGNSDFITTSIPSEKERRRMDVMVTQLEPKWQLMNRVFLPSDDGQSQLQPWQSECRSAWAYEVGTEYARFLREITVLISKDEGRSLESRMIGAQALMAALPNLAESFAQSADSKKFPSGNVLVRALFPHWPKANSGTVCEAFKRVFAAEFDAEAGSKVDQQPESQLLISCTKPALPLPSATPTPSSTSPSVPLSKAGAEKPSSTEVEAK